MELLEGTVDVPGAGKVKKRYVMIPAGIALVYVIYRWYQASRDDGPPASDGLYSSADLSDYGLSTTGGPTHITGNSGNVNTDGTNPDAINTNADWTRKAAELLTTAGYDAQTVYAALGEFLARRSLDKTEASIARAALAVAGQPPVGGPYSVIEAAVTGPVALTAPTGVKVTGTTTTSVTLSWNKVAGAGYYRIYRSGSSSNVGAVDAAHTTFTVGGLQPNTEYSFQVAADTTTDKPGPKSAAVKGKTAALKLTAPKGLKASAITKSSFRVTADAVPGAGYYRWYVGTKASGATDKPYRDFTGLKANTSYTISVAADTTTQAPGPKASITVKTKK
ncbi:MAG TPA: fibronectin type III domain-containing protein [Streptomyces sp.]|nr:fibronectin type III domain-containing protein [Streptomyces sp.]